MVQFSFRRSSAHNILPCVVSVGENPSLSSRSPSYWSNGGCTRDVIPTAAAAVPTDVYSRKVFVGGLPPDIDDGKPCKLATYKPFMLVVFAEEIKCYFEKFGPLTVDWPHKAQTKAYFPPKGEVFKMCQLWVANLELFIVYRLCIPVVPSWILSTQVNQVLFSTNGQVILICIKPNPPGQKGVYLGLVWIEIVMIHVIDSCCRYKFDHGFSLTAIT